MLSTLESCRLGNSKAIPVGLRLLGLWQKPLAVRAGCRYDWWQHMVLSAGLGSIRPGVLQDGGCLAQGHACVHACACQEAGAVAIHWSRRQGRLTVWSRERSQSWY